MDDKELKRLLLIGILEGIIFVTVFGMIALLIVIINL